MKQPALFMVCIIFCCLFSKNSQAQTEVGTNDFRISDMGTNGNTDLDANDSSIAYNSVTNQYLVVWSGDNTTNGEFEIYGQLLAADGTEIGSNDFRISDMGPDGDANYDAQKPSVVYNATDNEYLVIWIGDDNTAPLVNNETEIFGQRLAADGSEIGANDFRISDMGIDGNISFGILGVPISAVYNSINNEYLVVWIGDDNTGALVDNELEVFGQILMADGSEIGSNDFRISDMGPNGSLNYAAFSCAVAFNSTFNNYLVVWSGDDDTGLLVNNESEIFGQRLSSIGAEIGSSDFRISDMGPDGDVDYDAATPSVTYNTNADEYLVIWSGDDNIAPLVEDEFEIFGQRLSFLGGEVGDNDFRISDMGADGETFSFTNTPSLAYNGNTDEYMVVWRGDDASVNQQIHVQLLTANGMEIGTNDLLISDSNWDAALYPKIVYNSAVSEYLVTWSKTSNVPPFSFGEFEIFGQRLSANAVLPVEFIDFIANRKVDFIELNWQTATEIRNQGFNIQRSLDGHFFEKIGWELGKGSSNQRNDYQFKDFSAQPNQGYYYRLQQVDLDGVFSFSNIVFIPPFKQKAFSVYPNPFVDEVFIKTDKDFQPTKITIYNAVGQLVEVDFFYENQKSLSLRHLPKGMYQISIWDNQELIFSKKVIKY